MSEKDKENDMISQYSYRGTNVPPQPNIPPMPQQPPKTNTDNSREGKK